MIDDRYYNEGKREITTIAINEYILDDFDESRMNVFKKIKLGVNDYKDHYSIIIINDLEEYIAKLMEEVE